MVSDLASLPTWPFAPNWRYPYTVTYEFRTDVFEADDGSEQRRALRSTPRKTIGFTALAHGAGTARLNSFLRAWQNKPILLPEVTRAVRVTDVSGTALTLDQSAPAWATTGAPVITYDPHDGYRFTRITASSGAVIQMQATGSVTNGALIHPAIVGLLDPSLQWEGASTRAGEIKVRFSAVPCTEPYDFGDPTTSYRNIEWLRLDHNWVDGLPVEHKWVHGVTDFGRGRTSDFATIAHPATVRGYDLLLRDAEPLVAFFGRMRGRRGRFLVSTMEEDLQVIGNVGGSLLRVEGTVSGVDPLRTAIELEAVGVGRLARIVTDIQASGDQSVLTLDDGLPAIHGDQIRRISWLQSARFAQDILEVVYSAPRAARVRLNVQSLPLGLTADPNILRATPDDDTRATPAGDERQVIGR